MDRRSFNSFAGSISSPGIEWLTLKSIVVESVLLENTMQNNVSNPLSINTMP